MTDHSALIADARTTLADAERCHRLGIQPNSYEVERSLRAAAAAVEDLVAERDALQAQLDRVRSARSNHPECDRHSADDSVLCGWKCVVLDIDAALAKGNERHVLDAADEAAADRAKDVIAQLIAAEVLRECEPLWENYPEIGEYDWEDIARRVGALLVPPTSEEFAEAYAVLKAGAEAWEHDEEADA